MTTMQHSTIGCSNPTAGTPHMRRARQSMTDTHSCSTWGAPTPAIKLTATSTAALEMPSAHQPQSQPKKSHCQVGNSQCKSVQAFQGTLCTRKGTALLAAKTGAKLPEL